MRIAFRVLWQAIKDYYEEMFILAGASLLWAVLAVPVVTLPPATAGMYYLTNHVARHKSVEFGLFFEGFKKFFVKSWLLTLLNLGVLFVLYTNYQFYARYEAQWSAVIQGLVVGAGVIWCLIQIYVFPMLLEQQEPRLLLALRNAAMMAVLALMGNGAVLTLLVHFGIRKPPEEITEG